MINKVARTAFQRMVRLYAVQDNVRLGRNVHIGLGTRLWAPSSLVVHDDVYIGKFCTLEVDGSIGAGSLIANSVGVVGRRDHDLRQIGTPMRSARWVGGPEALDLRTAVNIGPDVWIGYGAIILAPVTIGRGAIISAGAVVVRDVEPYSIVAGNPGFVIGNRFTPSEIEEHEAFISNATSKAPNSQGTNDSRVSR